MSVTRYNKGLHRSCMREHPTGPWVKYADHEAELTRLREELQEMTRKAEIMEASAKDEMKYHMKADEDNERLRADNAMLVEALEAYQEEADKKEAMQGSYGHLARAYGLAKEALAKVKK